MHRVLNVDVKFCYNDRPNCGDLLVIFRLHVREKILCYVIITVFSRRSYVVLLLQNCLGLRVILYVICWELLED